MQRLTIFILMLSSSLASAISEVNYDQVYQQEVMPFFKSQAEWGKFQTPDGITISHVFYQHPEPVADVVILPGWTEAGQKYAELIFDLYQFKFNIHLLEWRGQGYSERISSHPERTHVTTYEEYVIDLDTFLKTVVKPRAEGRRIVGIAHSMGANITSIYLSKGKSILDKVVFSSPMLDIKTAPYPEWVAWLIARVMELMGQGDSFLPGHGPFVKEDVVNISTRSETRYWKTVNYKAQNPETITNGASFSWLRSSLEATWYMKRNAHLITVPVLMLQAGDDFYVDTEGQDMVCKNAKNCFKIVFPSAFHEVYNDGDLVRSKAVKETVEFILDHF